MQVNTHLFCQLLNTVKKFNGIKPLLWFTVLNIGYYVTKIMRILNY
jgi:hypothetical protein